MILFHIRKQRNASTFCGAAGTDHDIKAGWQAVPFGDFLPCEYCIQARAQATLKRHAGGTARRAGRRA